MSWLDKSCLQLVVKRKDKPETLTFQVRANSRSFLYNLADLGFVLTAPASGYIV